MVIKCNQFIDDDNLTDKSSLIHLLDRHDADDCDELPLLKHSPFYSENQFTSLINTNYHVLCILDMNIANAFTKFDELEAFIINNNNHHLYSHKQLHVHGTYKALCTKLQLH